MNERDWRADQVRQSAFDQLLKSDEAYFRTVNRQLARIAAGMGLPPAEIERVVAETWRTAVENRHLFEGGAIKQRLRSWLMKVVYGKSVDALRRLSNHAYESFDTREDELIDERQADCAEAAELHERLEMLLEKASQDNELNAGLVRAHYFQGLSIQELAQQHGMTAKSVDHRIRRQVGKMGDLEE